jgi:hypothetical protein
MHLTTKIYSPSTAADQVIFRFEGDGISSNATHLASWFGAGNVTTQGVVKKVRFFASSGNLSFRYSLYGYL